MVEFLIGSILFVGFMICIAAGLLPPLILIVGSICFLGNVASITSVLTSNARVQVQSVLKLLLGSVFVAAFGVSLSEHDWIRVVLLSQVFTLFATTWYFIGMRAERINMPWSESRDLSQLLIFTSICIVISFVLEVLGCVPRLPD